MSGDITDLPVRRCPSCGCVYMEDEQMYLDPSRCPRCNAEPAEKTDKGEEA